MSLIPQRIHQPRTCSVAAFSRPGGSCRIRSALCYKECMAIDNKTRLLFEKYLEEQRRVYEGISRSLELCSQSILDLQRKAIEAWEAAAAKQKQVLDSIRMPVIAMPDIPDYATQAAEAAKAMERAISYVAHVVRDDEKKKPVV